MTNYSCSSSGTGGTCTGTVTTPCCCNTCASTSDILKLADVLTDLNNLRATINGLTYDSQIAVISAQIKEITTSFNQFYAAIKAGYVPAPSTGGGGTGTGTGAVSSSDLENLRHSFQSALQSTEISLQVAVDRIQALENNPSTGGTSVTVKQEIPITVWNGWGLVSGNGSSFVEQQDGMVGLIQVPAGYKGRIVVELSSVTQALMDKVGFVYMTIDEVNQHPTGTNQGYSWYMDKELIDANHFIINTSNIVDIDKDGVTVTIMIPVRSPEHSELPNNSTNMDIFKYYLADYPVGYDEAFRVGGKTLVDVNARRTIQSIMGYLQAPAEPAKVYPFSGYEWTHFGDTNTMYQSAYNSHIWAEHLANNIGLTLNNVSTDNLRITDLVGIVARNYIGGDKVKYITLFIGTGDIAVQTPLYDSNDVGNTFTVNGACLHVLAELRKKFPKAMITWVIPPISYAETVDDNLHMYGFAMASAISQACYNHGVNVYDMRDKGLINLKNADHRTAYLTPTGEGDTTNTVYFNDNAYAIFENLFTRLLMSP